MYNTTNNGNNDEVIHKFKNHFQVFGVNNFNLVDQILLDNKCDIFYIIKSGEYEGQVSKVCKTVVHCVFNCCHPHGNVYASVSEWVINNDNKYPTVPHMINLPDNNENLRKELNIPEDALVYGRHGGLGQFDIKYVHKIVYDVAKTYPNIYFLFLHLFSFQTPIIYRYFYK